MAGMNTLDAPAPDTSLNALQVALTALRTAPEQLRAFVELARSQTALLNALPPRYTEVFHGLLDRLESSALFSEESCSFSQHDLLDSLQLWLDKARQQVQTPR